MPADNSSKRVLISVSNKTIVRAVIVIALTFLALRLARSVSYYLSLIGMGAFVALALNPFVDWLQKIIGGKRLVSIALTFLLFVLIVGSFVANVTPPLVRQGVSFVNSLPDTVDNLKTSDSTSAQWARRLGVTSELDDISSSFSSRAAEYSDLAISTAGRVANGLVSIIAVLVLAFMMLSEIPKISDKFWGLLKKSAKDRYRPIAEKMYGALTGYITGQVAVSGLGALITYVLLSILSIPNPLLLAVVIFILGLIPLIGLPLGAAVLVVTAGYYGIDRAAVLLLFFILYWQIQISWLRPVLFPVTHNLSPLTVFIAAIAGLSLAGLIGAIIAVPVAACLRIVALDYLEHKRSSAS